MKILVLLSTLQRGGMSRYAIDLSRCLSEIYNVNFAYFHEDNKDSINNVSVNFLSSPKIVKFSKFTLAFWRFIKLSRLYIKEKFEIVICHDPSATLLALTLKIFFPSIKVIAICNVPKKLLTRLDLIIISKFYIKANIVVAPTAFIRDELNAIMKSRHAIVIRIPMPEISLICDWPRNNAYSQKRFVFAGRLEPEKNPFFFLQMAQVDKQNDYLLFGDGKLLPSLKRFAYINSIDNISFLGWRKMSDILQNAQIIVIPSLTESFGIVAIEAWANAVPTIVSSSAQGIVENLDDELGVACNLKDGPQKWVELANKLKNQKISDKAVINVIERYHTSQILELWRVEIEKIMN